ncbi:hypothetical protein HB777_14815 [Mesorhizobium loti]|nr:hypothetical protein HB777_14815 [Mesorhizobium loti]
MEAVRFFGPDLSDRTIKKEADQLASRWKYVNKGSVESVDILDLIEFKLELFAPGFSLAIISSNDMMKILGASSDKDISLAFTSLSEKIIYVTENLYEDAYNGDGWARILLAHELGHAVLHSDYSNRTAHFNFKYTNIAHSIDELRIRGIPLYRDPERQADIFATCLMAPDYLIEGCSSALVLSKKAKIDMSSASTRLKFFNEERLGHRPSFSIRLR